MKQRTFYFDLLRLISCFLVVMVHVSGIYFQTYKVNSLDWLISNIYNCLAIIGVPIFFMISGALLLNPSRELQIKKFLGHNVVSLLIFYFVTIFAYNVLYFCISVQDKNFASFKETVLLKTLCGNGTGVGHLWFLPTLISIYLLVPIIKQGLTEEKNCIYFCTVFFAVSVLWNSVLFFQIPYYVIFESLKQVIPFYLFSTYAGYFVSGHYLHAFVIPKIRKNPNISGKGLSVILGIVFIIGLCLTVITNAFFSMKKETAMTTTNTPFFFGHFLSSTALFLGLGVLFYEKHISSKYLSVLSELTLGIYLIHPAIITFLKEYLGYSLVWKYPVISIVLVTMLLFSVSLLLVLFIRLIRYFFTFLLSKVEFLT